MPTRKKSSPKAKSRKRSAAQAVTVKQGHAAFWPLLAFSLVLWVLYRSIFTFPVWFDESIGKAIFFGLPVWSYAVIGGVRSITQTFDFTKIKRGLMVGLAFGGTFGFVAALLALLQKGGSVQNLELYASDRFWWEFLFALMTSFWETLFFFSFIMTVVQEKYRKLTTVYQVLIVALVFLAFHLPNSVLRFSGPDIMYQVFLMLLFGIGQAYLFASEKNGYALVISQAIWGMVLLVHF